MNKLLCMRAFASLAESASVAAAGEKLGLSGSAIAKCVSRLEAELGVQLVARTTRAMRLTDLGEAYYRQCLSVLSEIDEGEALIKRGNAQPGGTIKVRVPVAFGHAVLLPRLAQFQALYPRIQLRIRLGDRPVDLLAEGLDMAVVTGPLPSSSCISRTLSHGRLVTAASPAYLARHGTPASPADLAAHHCITVEATSWAFQQDGMAVNAAMRAQFVVDSDSALREAAISDAGIIQARSWAIERELRSGALRAVLADYAAAPVELMVICTPQRYMPAKLRAMLDFLHDATRQAPAKATVATVATLRPAERIRAVV